MDLIGLKRLTKTMSILKKNWRKYFVSEMVKSLS